MDREQTEKNVKTEVGHIRHEPAGRVDMHFVVRLLTNPKTGVQEVLGYLSFKQGIKDSLFSGPPSEKTAHFTLRIQSLTAVLIENTGPLKLQLRPPGQTLTIYLKERPDQDWDKPETFSDGKPIATYYEDVAQLINLGPVAESTATFTLTEGTEYSFKNQRHNFMRETPSGVTAVSYFSMEAVKTALVEYPVCFCGAGLGYTIEAPHRESEDNQNNRNASSQEDVLDGSFVDTITAPGRQIKALFTFTKSRGIVGMTFSADGSTAIGHGAWERMERNVFALTFIFLGQEGGSPFLRLKVRARITLNEARDRYKGVGQMDYYNSDGSVARALVAPVSGKRITVEQVDENIEIPKVEKGWEHPSFV